MLTCDDLIVRQGQFALHAALQIPARARVAVIGPSGGGKSTFLLSLGGFLTPSAGRILWSQRDITDLPPAARPMAMLFQDSNLFPHLTLAQNVALALGPSIRLTPERKALVSDSLARTGLTGMEDRLPRDVSGGQRSRAALARALLQNETFLLLDEPFAALGPALKAEMLDLVHALTTENGTTLLMVTHEPAEAKRIATHTCVVADGQVAPPVETEALFADPTAVLRAYLG
ncbi:MAG: ATP-binding cassette domain-containing protein [Pseudomonadota bacterium]